MIKQRNIPRSTQEAAEWLTRLNVPNIQSEDLDAFSAWRADPDNKAAYERLEDLSNSLRSLENDPDIEAVAAAAMQPTSNDNGKRVVWRRGYFVIGTAIAALLIGGVSAVFVWRQPTYSTQVGQTFSASLDDGSRVILNTDTQIRVYYSAGERRIELLRGQALFEVAHNAARPFIVSAGDTETRALGTKFEVRRVGESVRVTLTQGSVEITDRDTPTAKWKLTPGQALALPPRAPQAAKPIAVDTKAATSWTTGDLTFQDVSLAEAVAELNRYSRRKILLNEHVDAERVVNGVFSAGDPSDFIAAASSLYGLKSTKKPNGDIELQPKVPEAT